MCDNWYLIIVVSILILGNKLFIKDLIKFDSKLVIILDNIDLDILIIDNDGLKLYLVINLNVLNMCVVIVDVVDLSLENW